MNEDKLIIDYLEQFSRNETSTRIKLRNYKKRQVTFSKRGDKLFIIFPPWQGLLKYNFFIRRSIVRRKWNCIEYYFKPEILTADYKTTKNLFLSIRNDVLHDIRLLQKKYRFSEINLIGFSLGSVHTLMVANNLPLTNKVYLHAAGDRVSDCLWEGLRTQNIRRALERQGVTLAKLRAAWEPIEPINNTNNLQGKIVQVVLSKKDVVIPYIHGKRLVEKLKQSGANVSVIIYKHLGHYLTIIHDFLFLEDTKVKR